MRHPVKKAFYTLLFLCLTFALTAPSSAALPSSSPYRLSFVIQPSDILAGSSLFATTVLTHPMKNLIRSNAIQFQVFDRHSRPVSGTSVLPITTDSRGLAVFVDKVLQPGKGYTLVASCGNAVIRSRPFDVIATEPAYPLPSDPESAAYIAELPPVEAKKSKAAVLPTKALPQAKKSTPIVIPNPNPGTAQEYVFPAALCPEPLKPTPMPEPLSMRLLAGRTDPLPPAAFDLVAAMPPSVPKELDVRGVAFPGPAEIPPMERYPY